MKIASIVSLATLAMALAVSGCKSKYDEGVKSNMLKQWTEVAASTEKTTAAAEAVLNEEKLADVKSHATNLDGTASGKKADGTKIDVGITKTSDNISQVSVSVGTMGDAELGANLAKRIKMKAEGK